MSGAIISAIVVGTGLAYLFAAGLAWGFAKRWLKNDEEVSCTILAAAWPLYLAAFIGYRIMYAVRWVPSLGIRAVHSLAARKMPRATVVSDATTPKRKAGR